MTQNYASQFFGSQPTPPQQQNGLRESTAYPQRRNWCTKRIILPPHLETRGHVGNISKQHLNATNYLTRSLHPCIVSFTSPPYFYPLRSWTHWMRYDQYPYKQHSTVHWAYKSGRSPPFLYYLYSPPTAEPGTGKTSPPTLLHIIKCFGIQILNILVC